MLSQLPLPLHHQTELTPSPSLYDKDSYWVLQHHGSGTRKQVIELNNLSEWSIFLLAMSSNRQSI